MVSSRCEGKPRSGRHLELDDRLRIAGLRMQGAGVREIAREMGWQS
ncbi:helix-turn-helix domain-containing protein [Pseudoclavibacter helvolus]